MSSRPLGLAHICLPALLLLGVSARAEAPTATTPAETSVDDNGHFVVKFPGEVKRASMPVDTPVGKVMMNVVSHEAGVIAYMIIYSDYPAGSVTKTGGPAKVCENASKGAVDSVNGTIRTSAACQLGDVTGLEIVADIPSRASVARLRFFVVGDRLYQVMFIGPPGQEASPAVMNYFASFRLLR